MTAATDRLRAKGQTLIEVIVAGAILTVALLATMQYAALGFRQFQNQRQTSTMDRLALQLTRIVGMPAALRQSYNPNNPNATTNLALYNCMTGQTACDPTQIYDLSVYCPSYNPTTGLANCPLITGTQANPQYYDYLGYPCTGANGSCPASTYPFEAYTQFQAVCQLPYTVWVGPNGGYNPAQTNIQSLYANPTSCQGGTPETIMVRLFLQTQPGAPYSLPPYSAVVGVPTGGIIIGGYCLTADDNICM